MTHSPAVLIGLMSGTSADGISAAAVRLAPPKAELLHFLTIDYTPAQRDRLLRAAETATPDEYARLNFDLGAWLGDAAREVMGAAHLSPRDVRAIASHGHTLWHIPPHGTWQAGESAVIAERTGVDVVSDFRVRDVAAGGQGAPLVAIADQMLFAHDTEPRALQNLGGIANVSVVPRRGDPAAPRAFDTGPGCTLIDGITRRLVPQLDYDVDGRLASHGMVVAGVLEELLADPFFAAPPPKSTGREHFGLDYLVDLINRCLWVQPAARPEDIIATAVALTARSIALAYERFIPEALEDVLLSGGGAKNPALVRAISQALAPRVVRRFSEEFFDDEAKEAVAFALLGWLHLERRAGNVAAATGARGARILGKLTPA